MHFRDQFFLCAAALTSLLAGCAVSGGSAGSAPAAAVDETAEFAPVAYDQVCLLLNPAVKSDKLVDALEEGLKKSGASVKRLDPGTAPSACPFVITYEAQSQKGLIQSISFQTFEHGIPRVQANGRAKEGRALTVGLAAAYAQELVERLRMQRRLDEAKASQPPSNGQ